ncbi:hypothetical protein [Ascidiaceihabitans sp.]
MIISGQQPRSKTCLFTVGDREALEGKLQAKYGKTKEEVDSFLASH